MKSHFTGGIHVIFFEKINKSLFRSSRLCWTYFLKNYPADFMQDRQLISNYEDSIEKRYVKPAERPSSPKPFDDLEYRS